ncbi:MAG: cytochrome C [Actinomycetota bacterium]|nr:cytochrome C [Actinomycetota bacterium]
MQEHAERYRLPKWLFSAAALLLMVSLLLPYWILLLSAPQFPDGLTLRAYVNRLEGDVGELDGLNHYIGLKSFSEAAPIERSIAVPAIIAVAVLLIVAVFSRSRWVLVVVTPALFFPVVFVIDLQFWLWLFGNNLDPAAPLAAAVGEFTPPVFGPAEIAQFDTLALPGPGLLLALTASALIIRGLYLRRRACRPHAEAISRDE